MILTGLSDVSGEATRAAAEAQAALGRGDTERAATFHTTAGEILETRAAKTRKLSDKHLIRFLAASQYYHAGEYQRAQKLLRKIEGRFLVGEAQTLFKKFVRDVRDRSAANYHARLMSALHRAGQAKDHEQIITILQEHPYVLPRAKMALLRAYCCQALADGRAAALFFEDARRFEPENANPGFESSREDGSGKGSANGSPSSWPALVDLLKP